MWWTWVPPLVSTLPGHQLTWARIMWALPRMKPNESRKASRIRKWTSLPGPWMPLSYAFDRSSVSRSTGPMVTVDQQVPGAGERISRSDGVRRSTGGGRRPSGLPPARLRLDVRGAARHRGGRRCHRRERLAADRHHGEPDSPDRPLRGADRARHLAHSRDPADVPWAGGRRVLRLRGPQRRGVRVHLRALHRAV